MKKLIFILLALFTLAGCTKPTLENSVEDSDKFTTVEMQNLPKDTVVVSVDGTKVYIFNDNNTVEYQAELMNVDTTSINSFFLFMTVMLSIGFILIFFTWLFTD
jgi:uncharacterized lipoprotein YajG